MTAADLAYPPEAVQLARQLPEYWHPPGRQRVHPYMPEDGDAVARCLRDLISRGDQLATDVQHWERAANDLYRRLFDADGCVRDDVDLHSVFAWFSDHHPDFNADYDWRKARERMEYVAGREVNVHPSEADR